MIVDMFVFLHRISPGLRKRMWRRLYQLISRYYRDRDWTFMNWGYAPLPPENHRPALLPADETDRYFIQLYHHVIGGIPVEGKDLLEVGCGRGGGCSYLARYHAPASVVGVDLSPNSVRFCGERHGADRLRFQTGDSENLPFADESFDAVVNVESSHCYPSFGRFLSEVRRILRRGGTLHLADVRDRDEVEGFHEAIRTCGLCVVRSTDITANVLAALKEDGERRLARFRETLWAPLVRYFQEFAGNEGSEIRRKLSAGATLYFSCLLKKA
jgi:SAM-dependent methyltransferase